MKKTTFFGEVDTADGTISLMDGGIHGVQGHTIVATPSTSTLDWTWERRIDGVQPHGDPGEGHFTPTDDERARVAQWMDTLWNVARTEYFSDEPQVPRWVWVIAIRRGEELRVLEGGDVSWGDEPEALSIPLTWLRDRVDKLAGV